MGHVGGRLRTGHHTLRGGDDQQRVLVVEDDYLMAEQLCDLLADAGFVPVGPVPSVDRAIELALSQPLDAAVLDVRVQDGLVFDVCTVLRSKDVPFLFVTGSAEEARTAGTNAPIISKPFDPAELIEVVRLLVETDLTCARLHKDN